MRMRPTDAVRLCQPYPHPCSESCPHPHLCHLQVSHFHERKQVAIFKEYRAVGYTLGPALIAGLQNEVSLWTF